MISFLLNIPYTILGIGIAALSQPRSVQLVNSKPYAVVFYVSSFWWARGYAQKARAATIGHVVLLGSTAKPGDKEHELIHVEQHARVPLIHPLLYTIELLRYGYRNNRYEIEAYERAGNEYTGDEALTRVM